MTVYVIMTAVKAVQVGPTSTGSQLVPPSQIAGTGVPPQQEWVATLNGVGNCSATVQLVGTNDGVNFVPVGSITLTAASADLAPGIADLGTNRSYDRYGGYVSQISGTNASVGLTLSA